MYEEIMERLTKAEEKLKESERICRAFLSDDLPVLEPYTELEMEDLHSQLVREGKIKEAK